MITGRSLTLHGLICAWRHRLKEILVAKFYNLIVLVLLLLQSTSTYQTVYMQSTEAGKDDYTFTKVQVLHQRNFKPTISFIDQITITVVQWNNPFLLPDYTTVPVHTNNRSRQLTDWKHYISTAMLWTKHSTILMTSHNYHIEYYHYHHIVIANLHM